MSRTKSSLGKIQKVSLEAIQEELAQFRPQTARQLYYRLISRGIKVTYDQVQSLVMHSRQDGAIPWSHVEDRTRQATVYESWPDLGSYLWDVQSDYRLDIWQHQPRLVEVWIEKDALSTIVEQVCNKYRVSMQVTRGYNSWSNMYDAVQRYRNWDGGNLVTILYYGDLDCDGWYMSEWLVKGPFAHFAKTLGRAIPTVERCLLNPGDVAAYGLEFAQLPPKRTSKQYGYWLDTVGPEAMAVEIDAVPAAVLQERVAADIEAHIDMAAFGESLELEGQQDEDLGAMIDRLSDG